MRKGSKRLHLAPQPTVERIKIWHQKLKEGIRSPVWRGLLSQCRSRLLDEQGILLLLKQKRALALHKGLQRVITKGVLVVRREKSTLLTCEQLGAYLLRTLVLMLNLLGHQQLLILGWWETPNWGVPR